MINVRSNKNIGLEQNVTIKVIDSISGKVVSVHEGHNTATNSMLLGIAHYLTGDGVLNQGYHMLKQYVPQYISLGTMGLISQIEDEEGLPAGIGVAVPDVPDELEDELNDALTELETAKAALDDFGCCIDTCSRCERCETCSQEIQAAKERYDTALEAYEEIYNEVISASEEDRFKDYMQTRPGYGADGYDANENNNRRWMGLGYPYADRPNLEETVNCELISDSYPRVSISFRDIVPETESEIPKTIDVIFSAMVSVGALKQFRDSDKDYLFITEAGLWSRQDWSDSGENGLLAAYRIAPPNEENWDMSIEENRHILKENIIRVGVNQVVQVIWKIQLGSIDQFGGWPEPDEDYLSGEPQNV